VHRAVKTAVLTCDITLPDSPHPIIISRNLGFRALHLAGRNEFRFSRLTGTNFFSPFLAAGFCPKNLAFVRKIMALLDSRGGGLKHQIGVKENGNLLT